MKKHAVITCTPGRRSFELACQYVQRQHPQPGFKLQWIVVINGSSYSFSKFGSLAMRYGAHAVVVRHTLERSPGQLARNIYSALNLLDDDVELVSFMEDDDWYAADYLRAVEDAALASPPMILGQPGWWYYHLGQQRYQRNWTYPYATMAGTTIHARYLGKLEEGCQIFAEADAKGLDAWLWKSTQTGRVFLSQRAEGGDRPFVVGIKGYDGQDNVGVGGSPGADWVHDPYSVKLREWTKNDPIARHNYEKEICS